MNDEKQKPNEPDTVLSLPEHAPSRNKGRILLIIAVSLILLAGAGLITYMVAFEPQPTVSNETVVVEPKVADTPPTLETKDVLTGLSNPWDIGFLPDKTLVFTERGGNIKALSTSGQVKELGKVGDVYARGEGGLLGLAVDTKFNENRYIYTCFNSTKGAPDVRLARWKVKNDLSGLEGRTDIITGMPSNASGRHSGCRPRMDKDGVLWVGTGDTAIGTYPQSRQNLGGKVLRVGRDGKGVSGNMPSPFDNRIYSYGHRNVQGIALLPSAKKGVIGYSAEHGSSEDDEVNELKQGNFGWDPIPGEYNETVPMTDKKKFPDAIEAVWKSGAPTIAISGITSLNGPQWKGWDGALAVAVQKDKHVRILRLNDEGKIRDESEQLKTFGRIRSVVQGPDGYMYLSTDNGGGQDRIVRATPR